MKPANAISKLDICRTAPSITKPSQIVLLMLYQIQRMNTYQKLVAASPAMNLCVSSVVYLLKHSTAFYQLQQHLIILKKADVQYDATLAKNNIFKWLQHIICYAQQDKAKQDCLESLSNQTGLLIQDCCQNVFPNLKSSYVNLIMQVLILAVSMHNHFMRYANLMKFFFCTLITMNLKRAKI